MKIVPYTIHGQIVLTIAGILGSMCISIEAKTYTVPEDYSTIQQAVDVAGRGDIVEVAPGTYPEEITLKNSGLTIRAQKPNDKPKIDGGNRSRRHGFFAPKEKKLSDVTIDGFEIFGQDDYGIFLDSDRKELATKKFIIKNNIIHHIRYLGMQIRGTGHVIDGNIIYMIGNDKEASGIHVDWAEQIQAVNNQIYLVRKQGIRSRVSRDVLIQGNIVHSCTVGLAWNDVTGRNRTYNNYVYQVWGEGFSPKHINNPGGSEGWNQFWHNTIFNSYGRAMRPAGNSPPVDSDFVDIRNNIFSVAGDHIFSDVGLAHKGPNYILDHNLYHREPDRPRFLYTDRWFIGGVRTIEEIYEETNWEKNGQEFNPELNHPYQGNLDYPQSSRAAEGGLDLTQIGDARSLPTPYGKQLGARGLKQTVPRFNLYPIKAVAASANFDLAKNTTDHRFYTTWHSGDRNQNQWITYDLGAPRRIDVIVVGPGPSHLDQEIVRDFSIEVSDNQDQGFKTVFSDTQKKENIPNGNWWICEISPPVQARFVRYQMKNNHGATRIRLKEFVVGKIVAW